MIKYYSSLRKAFIIIYCISIVINISLGLEQNQNVAKSIHYVCEPFAHVQWTNDICGIGTISRVRNEKCIKWKYYKWHKITSVEDTTLCKIHKNDYYCATGYDTWDYCKKINCVRSSPSRTCEANIDWTSTDLSIDIDFSKISTNDELLILSYDKYDQCQISKSCQNCQKSNQIIITHLSSCIQIPGIGSYDNIIHYSNLLQLHSYTFYLLPVVDYNTIGSIAKLELKTRLSKPSIPSNLQLISVLSNSISMQWDQPIPNKKFGVAESYQIQLILRPIVVGINSTILNYISFTHLKENTEYCFTIIAINKGGHSLPTSPLCVRTKSVIPKITKIQFYESKTEITIIWEMDSKNAIENYYFFFIVTDNHNKCMFFILFLCEDCSKQATESYLNESDREKFNKMKICAKSKSENFIKSTSKFVTNLLKPNLIHFEDIIANITIYSINFMGLHQIGIKSFVKEKKSSNSWSYIFIVLGLVFLLIFIVIFIIYRKRIWNRFFFKLFDKESLGSSDNEIELEILNNEEGPEEGRQYYDENQIEIWSKEYKTLNLESKKYEKLNNLKTSIALLAENVNKNRFKNLLPYDHTRVVLKGNEDESDYINASYIPLENNIQEAEYIASQGPMMDEVSDFWLMIWEQYVSIIVMLTRTNEEDKFKCMQYWPNEIGMTEKFGPNSQFQVTLEEEIDKTVYIERKFNVLQYKSQERRIIIQLQMESWLDHSELKLKDFEAILNRFHQLIILNYETPYLIHCSAGVGRTGTFIVIDRIIRKLKKKITDFNVHKEVLEIRNYRNGAVQRKKQYIFIYEFIQYYLNKIGSSFEGSEGINLDNEYFN